jgi:hypothetical protein
MTGFGKKCTRGDYDRPKRRNSFTLLLNLRRSYRGPFFGQKRLKKGG